MRLSGMKDGKSMARLPPRCPPTLLADIANQSAHPSLQNRAGRRPGLLLLGKACQFVALGDRGATHLTSQGCRIHPGDLWSNGDILLFILPVLGGSETRPS